MRLRGGRDADPPGGARQEWQMIFWLALMICSRLGYVPGWMRRNRSGAAAIPEFEGGGSN